MEAECCKKKSEFSQGGFWSRASDNGQWWGDRSVVMGWKIFGGWKKGSTQKKITPPDWSCSLPTGAEVPKIERKNWFKIGCPALNLRLKNEFERICTYLRISFCLFNFPVSSSSSSTPGPARRKSDLVDLPYRDGCSVPFIRHPRRRPTLVHGTGRHNASGPQPV